MIKNTGRVFIDKLVAKTEKKNQSRITSSSFPEAENYHDSGELNESLTYTEVYF